MKEALKKQMEINRASNLLYSLSHKILTIDKSFQEKLLSLKSVNAEIPEETIEDTIDLLLEKVYAINQFINVDQNGRDRLRKLYTSTYNRITGESFFFVMEDHYKKLAEIISGFYPEEFRTALGNSEIIGRIRNEEYSLGLQVQVFEIEPGRIQEPFIDVGCGTSAVLVHYFLYNKIDAFGIDRCIRSESDRIQRCDWFEYDFSNREWGTVYSNMAFTNHLLYNSNYGDQNVRRRYERKYEEILESLQVNGEFVYAPGLAAIEQNLDNRKFAITRKVLIGDVSSTKIRRIAV